MKEARKEYFKRHSYNFTTEGTHDLLEIFRWMAESTKLLGSAIYEIQEVWKGPDELQQANYTLRALQKGLKFLQAVPPSESPKVMGLVGIHNPDTLHHFNGLTHCPWCGRRARMRGQLLTPCGQCTTGLAWCATNVTTTHHLHQTLSAAMASRTVNPQGKVTHRSQFHQSNCQPETGRFNLS